MRHTKNNVCLDTFGEWCSTSNAAVIKVTSCDGAGGVESGTHAAAVHEACYYQSRVSSVNEVVQMFSLVTGAVIKDGGGGRGEGGGGVGKS